MTTERRDRPRASFSGRASVVHARSRDPVELGIRDLSSSGARLVGRVQLLEGEQLRVLLELEGKQLSLAATVIRTDPQNAQMTIAFSALPPDAHAIIERAVETLLGSVRTEGAGTVIVLCEQPETRAALERDLAQLGRVAHPCVTLLDAMQALQDPLVRYEAVVVASQSEREPIGEVLKQLADHHPRLRRIVVFGAQLPSLDHAASGRVDAVLRTPVRIRALGRALGIRETDASIAMLPVGDD
ncbi:hypothetical protein BH11MYX3_BH11MYX3_45670 [soil metagenome]